jgi:hypothetical protein
MDELDDWERLLRQELRLREAPAGFSERVMARLPRSSPSGTGNRRLWPALQWVAAAVLLLVVASGSYWKHQQEEQIAGERARNQLMTALRMAGSTLHDVRHRIAEKHKESIQ